MAIAILLLRLALIICLSLVSVTGFVQQQHPSSASLGGSLSSSTSSSSMSTTILAAVDADNDTGISAEAEAEEEAEEAYSSSDESSLKLFNEFALFLQKKQLDIINDIEELEKESGNIENKFSNDCWGVFADDTEKEEDENDNENTSTSASDNTTRSNGNGNGSGGMTRVIQKGNIVEKGACSFTLIKGGKLTKERAESIRGRNNNSATSNSATSESDDNINIKEGDKYCAAALSMVLHTRSPMVPTFRSDVRIFLVESSENEDEDEDEVEGESESETKSTKTKTKTLAWFGGGSDLTPYYLFDDDIAFFHKQLYNLCNEHSNANDMINYKKMKNACDDYFFLPARNEHRGVGGMFFDDLPATYKTMNFVQDVTKNWMSSWFPIINKRQSLPYTTKQKEWQLLRRGRYLEFNLLYDRGVKFGLNTGSINPRVEGVMVSAPPLIAWEYNHIIEPNSEEERLMKILISPIEWV
jgi:coproporphyrinogen III oxidase